MLRVKIKNKNILPPGSKPESAKTFDPLRELTVRSLPQAPRGGGPRYKLKIALGTAMFVILQSMLLPSLEGLVALLPLKGPLGSHGRDNCFIALA